MKTNDIYEYMLKVDGMLILTGNSSLRGKVI